MGESAVLDGHNCISQKKTLHFLGGTFVILNVYSYFKKVSQYPKIFKISKNFRSPKKATLMYKNQPHQTGKAEKSNTAYSTTIS